MDFLANISSWLFSSVRSPYHQILHLHILHWIILASTKDILHQCTMSRGRRQLLVVNTLKFIIEIGGSKYVEVLPRGDCHWHMVVLTWPSCHPAACPAHNRTNHAATINESCGLSIIDCKARKRPRVRSKWLFMLKMERLGAMHNRECIECTIPLSLPISLSWEYQ